MKVLYIGFNHLNWHSHSTSFHLCVMQWLTRECSLHSNPCECSFVADTFRDCSGVNVLFLLFLDAGFGNVIYCGINDMKGREGVSFSS